MSLLAELSTYTPPPEAEVSPFDLLMEQIEDLLEDDATPQRPGGLTMGKATVVMLSPSDSEFDLKDKVFGLRNDQPIVQFLLDILGVPKDGSPIQIRTGYMRYVSANKLLFIAKFKSDLPGLQKPKKKETP